MRIAVTGGMGKLGQWVVRELAAAGHELTVFDRVPGPEKQAIRYLAGEITDLGQVFGALSGAEAVVHLAAVHRYGITSDDVTFRTNVLGTFNVHEAAFRLGIPRVVSTSSESVLGWDYRTRDFLPDYLPIDEDHPVRPQDAYGLSKQAGESISRSYTEKCGMATIVLRPPWVASPEEMDELGRSGGRRPTRFVLYNYVDARDLAEAYRLAVERPLVGHTVLFTTANDSSVAEPLCELFPRLLPELGSMAQELTGTRPSVRNDRARRVLGWQPKRGWR
ncbi:MAG TPA: NAD(P)-dependent oxidoreductase [Chloroflexota bacterium]|nr:NAD(P)-dependent oxidoreductase [Chloroflexota bacterium]